MRILVVEDEPALREDLKTRLIDSGFGGGYRFAIPRGLPK
jgi:DNA-binding response OmpR family regulator